VNLWDTVVILAAGFSAGMINSAAGGGTLVSFPILVWLGRDPVIANATNTMALWPASLAGVLGYRRELAGTGRWLALFTVPSLLGGIVGAILLLRTPSRQFALIVPYLILFATTLFALQNPIQQLLRRGRGPGTAPPQPGPMSASLGALLFQFLVAVYGGYFGAGMGILMLAALGLLGLTDIHRMNGMKNFFAVSINGIAAVYFAASGAVNWPDALVMSAGSVVGGYSSAGLARRLGRPLVQRAVIVIGLAMTVSLLLRR
jgi:uncharacterized membrane protein YfcA